MSETPTHPNRSHKDSVFVDSFPNPRTDSWILSHARKRDPEQLLYIRTHFCGLASFWGDFFSQNCHTYWKTCVFGKSTIFLGEV